MPYTKDTLEKIAEFRKLLEMEGYEGTELIQMWDKIWGITTLNSSDCDICGQPQGTAHLKECPFRWASKEEQVNIAETMQKRNSMDPYCGCCGEGHDGPCYGPKRLGYGAIPGKGNETKVGAVYPNEPYNVRLEEKKDGAIPPKTGEPEFCTSCGRHLKIKAIPVGYDPKTGFRVYRYEKVCPRPFFSLQRFVWKAWWNDGKYKWEEKYED